MITYARRALFALMFALNIALFVALLYLFVSRGYSPAAPWTGVDLVTIVLAALGVLLTALGIFIAMLAIWGYQSLHSIAKETAERVARDRAEAVAASTASGILSALIPPASGLSNDYGAAAGKEDGNAPS